MSPRPHGQVLAPSILFGAVGLIVAVVFQMTGWLRSLDDWQLALLSSFTMAEETSQLSLLWVYCLGALFSFGIAVAILDCRGLAKRIMLCVSALFLTIGMVPSFFVWGIVFFPFFQIIAVSWASICVLVYAAQHTMPCERDSIAAKATHTSELDTPQRTASEKKSDASELEMHDPDAAYKPRP